MEFYLILGLLIIIIILYYLTPCGKRDFPNHIPHRPRFPHKKSVNGRYIKIYQPDQGYVNFNEIKVYSHDQVTDLALNKSTTSSSVYYNNVNQYGPQYTVDGDITTFFHSDLGSGQWFEVDLGTNIVITQIEIYSRPGCCSGRMGGCILTISDDGSNDLYTSSPFPTSDGGITYENNNNGYPIYTVNPPNPTVITSS